MIEIKRASSGDAEEIMNLIQLVHDQMEHPEWYVIDEFEYYSHFLDENNGVAYKAVDYDRAKIVGIFIAIVPDREDLNLGYDIGLSKDECEKVAVMDTAAVIPEYRGQNLQYLMMQAAEKELKQRGFCYLTATVHPENYYSLSNLLKQGYCVIETKEKYGGYLRHILKKNIALI